MNDDFDNFLVATYWLDEFLGLKDESLDKKEMIQKIIFLN